MGTGIWMNLNPAIAEVEWDNSTVKVFLNCVIISVTKILKWKPFKIHTSVKGKNRSLNKNENTAYAVTAVKKLW